MLLAKTYYSASSIYLSGNYDYDLEHWQKFNVVVPVLDHGEIVEHFNLIIRLTRKALRDSSLSPLLFLFPLRVAGARAQQKMDKQAVAELLCDIRKQFVVAEAMLGELSELWALDSVIS